MLGFWYYFGIFPEKFLKLQYFFFYLAIFWHFVKNFLKNQNSKKRWNTENSKKKWGFKFGILKKGQNAKLALFLVKKPGNPVANMLI